ncbi:MAG: LysM peptidoglycan-binding domain-containing protein [Elusimicrobia bacterium]|nr:LysM peptidoglycan-binding domain-containing protein [Elusimicrobiota bacterium]
MKRIISFAVTVAMVLQSFVGYAQPVSLPAPGTLIGLSETFAPVVLKGMVMHPEDPLLFDFVVDNGQTGLQGEALTAQATELVKYFLAALAVPNKDLWVNLSPAEKDRIMEEDLGRTAMGRDMLAQDYILKQMTASLIYPGSDLGGKFWDRIYAEAQAKLGTTDIPVDTINKVWIAPKDAIVFRQGNHVLVADARLKVMLETDYLAEKGPQEIAEDGALGCQESGVGCQEAEFSKQVLREVIIPVLEKEVNEGKNFAQVRQIFHSLILANWYKSALKESLLAQVYSDTQKTSGIEIADPVKEKEAIYEQYVETFRKGVFNYIKEDADPVTGEMVPRQYVSGGLDAAEFTTRETASPSRVTPVAGNASQIRFKMMDANASRTSAKTYTVKDGDRLEEIAAVFQVDLRALLGANGLKSGEPVYPGQTLRIPSSSDAAMAGDADGVVQALYEKIPSDRRMPMDRIGESKVVEVRGQISEAVNRLRQMIDFKGAKGRVPSDEEIMAGLIDTSVFSPAFLDAGLMEQLGEDVPPTFVFDGSLLTTYPGSRKPMVVALTLGDGYFAATATSVNLPNHEKYGTWKRKGLLSSGFDLKRFLLAKGGVRVYQLGKGEKDLKGTLEEKLRGERSKPLALEVGDLAVGMSGKVPAEILFEGGKTTIVVDEGVDHKKAIRSWVRSSILGGVLGRLYDAGPDMGSADLMGDLQDEANRVHRLLGLPEIPVTTSISGEVASFDHFKWTVTSISAFESFMVIFQDPWVRERYGIREKVDVVIQGFGDVGSGLVKYISERYGDLLKSGTIRFVGVADITGGVYDPEGLDIGELLRMRGLDPKALSVPRDYVAPEGRQIQRWKREKDTDIFFVRENGADPERSGIAFPAAGPGVFQTPEDARRLKSAGIDVLVSPANNVLKENAGLEAVLEEARVLYLSASSVSHGGIQTSTEEVFHIVYEGLKALREKVSSDENGWKAHIQSGIIGLTQSLIMWEVGKFKSAIERGERTTFHGIHMALAEQIQAQKDILLSLPPIPIFERVNDEVRSVWAQYERNGDALNADQKDAIALVIILNRIVEVARTFAMYPWRDRNNIVRARQATLRKMLENPQDVSRADQRIATYELGRFAAVEAREELRRVVVDPRFDSLVRGLAAEGFVSIGEMQDVPFLQEVARNARAAGQWDISFAANLAVERISAIRQAFDAAEGDAGRKALAHDLEDVLAAQNEKAIRVGRILGVFDYVPGDLFGLALARFLEEEPWRLEVAEGLVARGVNFRNGQGASIAALGEDLLDGRANLLDDAFDRLKDVLAVNPELIKAAAGDLVPSQAIDVEGFFAVAADLYSRSDAAETGAFDAAGTALKGGIDFGNGQFLTVIDRGADGVPVFDPAQVEMIRENLNGLVPVPVGAPQSVSMNVLLGLVTDPASPEASQLSFVPAGAVLREEGLV